MEEDNKAKSITALSKVQKRSLSTHVVLKTTEADKNDAMFQHSVLCQTFLPYRDPGNNINLWQQKQGAATLAVTPPDPIRLEAGTPVVFRSFMDFYPDGKFKKRIVHAVQVGNPDLLHYTYDLDNGALAQIWKGEFLNTSPMWDNRGDGSSRPTGAVLPLSDAAVVVAKPALFDTATSKTEPVADFRPKGYDLDAGDLPTFRYQRFGMDVEDQIRVAEGKYLNRTLTFANIPAANPYVCRLAMGREIVMENESLYLVDGKHYYIRLPKGEKATVENSGGTAVLYVPVKEKVEYSILW